MGIQSKDAIRGQGRGEGRGVIIYLQYGPTGGEENVELPKGGEGKLEYEIGTYIW